jgi:hypothetical protein
MENRAMNQEDLIKAIQRVGMGTFVKYYEAFSDSSKILDDLVNALIKIEGYGDDSARTKVNSARRIINENLGLEALKIISDSQRTDSWIAPKALYLKEYYEN